MNFSPENEFESRFPPFSDEAMEALDKGIGLADQGYDLDSEEIKEILRNFSDEEKEAIRISIGYAQSIKDLLSVTVSQEAKKRGKQQMLAAFDRKNDQS
jgi:hypothetical protein